MSEAGGSPTEPHTLSLKQHCLLVLVLHVVASGDRMAQMAFKISPKVIFLNGQFPASFSLFSSFQYTVDSTRMFNINNFLPMAGFEPRTSGIGSNRFTN